MPNTATTIDVRSLAGFKRFLATPGATIQLIRHDREGVTPELRPEMFAPRTVYKLQTNAVAFKMPDADVPSWLHWDTGFKAAGFRFDGDIVTVDLGSIVTGPNDKPQHTGFTRVFQYRLYFRD